MPVDPKELREAIERAVLWLPADLSTLSGVKGARDREALSVLRAFLDSGLTASERETVLRVVTDMIKETKSEPDYGADSVWHGLASEWLAALAPIAEGKEKRP